MSLRMSLLGLINLTPMSGYDLKKFFDDSFRFFWAAETSQIYRELQALERRGDIDSRSEESRKGPRRKVYSITDQGRSALREWLNGPPGDVDEDFRNEVLVRTFLSAEAEAGVAGNLIRSRLDAYRRELEHLDSVEARLPEFVALAGGDASLPYWKIALSRGKLVAQANIEWAEESLRVLEGLKK